MLAAPCFACVAGSLHWSGYVYSQILGKNAAIATAAAACVYESSQGNGKEGEGKGSDKPEDKQALYNPLSMRRIPAGGEREGGVVTVQAPGQVGYHLVS